MSFKHEASADTHFAAREEYARLRSTVVDMISRRQEFWDKVAELAESFAVECESFLRPLRARPVSDHAIQRLKNTALRGAKLNVMLQKQPSDFSFFTFERGEQFRPSHMLDLNFSNSKDCNATVITTVIPGIKKYPFVEIQDPADRYAMKVLSREGQGGSDIIILKAEVFLCNNPKCGCTGLGSDCGMICYDGVSGDGSKLPQENLGGVGH